MVESTYKIGLQETGLQTVAHECLLKFPQPRCINTNGVLVLLLLAHYIETERDYVQHYHLKCSLHSQCHVDYFTACPMFLTCKFVEVGSRRTK
jgi:hypothetical protein